MAKLTPKQKKFIAEYKKCGNATLSAKRAGYRANSEKAYRNIGSENLAKLGLYISEYEERIESEEIASVEEVNRFFTETMRNEELPMSDRIKAAELRMKAAGGFLDRSEVNLSGGAVILAGNDEIED